MPDLVRGLPADQVRRSAAAPPDEYSLWELIWSDYCKHYQARAETPRWRMALFPVRMVTNSCLHANLLARLTQCSHPRLTWIWRRLLLALHASDINRDANIGPGLMMPHPVGIIIGPRTVIGRNAVLMHMVSIGPVTTNWRAANAVTSLQIGDDVTVFPGAFILGEITIGDGAVIGANALVTRDVPAGHHINMAGKMRPATIDEQRGWSEP